MFGKKKPARSSKTTSETLPPCTCPTTKTWTDQQRRAFGEMPVKFRD